MRLRSRHTSLHMRVHAQTHFGHKLLPPCQKGKKKKKGPEWLEIHPQVPMHAMSWFLTATVPQSQAEGQTHAKFLFFLCCVLAVKTEILDSPICGGHRDVSLTLKKFCYFASTPFSEM